MLEWRQLGREWDSAEKEAREPVFCKVFGLQLETKKERKNRTHPGQSVTSKLSVLWLFPYPCCLENILAIWVIRKSE